MSAPVACPICGLHTLKQLFDDVRLSAELDHDLRNVGGLAAYMCTERSHIFFVLKKDLEVSALRVGSTSG